MKKNHLLGLLVSLLCALPATAQTFQVGGLTYKVTSATEKTVEVAKPSTAYAIAEVDIPATVTNDGVTYSVTSIAAQAFMSNSAVTSVTTHDGLLSIGDKAFFSCSNLTSITLANTIKSIGIWGIRAASKLTVLVLPDSLESIPTGFCWGNTKLKGITIPDKVKYIGENAFASCSGLDSVQIGAGVDTLAAKAFAYCSQVKKLISRAPMPPVCMDDKSIGSIKTTTPLYVSEKSLERYQKTEPWSRLTQILPYDPSGSLDDNTFVVAGVGYLMLSKENKTVAVTHIDTLVYKGEILVRPTVNYAGEELNVISVTADAFKNCSEVTQIELPASITNIGDNAFNGCSGLKHFLIKAGTPPALGTTVFTGINFDNCTLYALADDIEKYKTAAQWSEFIHHNVYIDEITIDGLTYKCNNVYNSTLDLKSAKGAKGTLIIPDKVMIKGYPFTITTIAGNAFYSTNITALTLPSTLKRIEGNAFFSCGEYDNPIDTIVVPEGVYFIGSNAFYGCHVNNVILPKTSLTELSNSAFYACPIKGIEIPGSVGVIGNSTFYGSDIQWVILGEGITEIKENAFWATDIGAVALPSTMKKIGSGAFAACSSLASLTINQGLESVAEDAFSNCNVLYKVFNFATTMPTGLEEALSAQQTGAERTTYTVSDICTNAAAFGRVILRPDLGSWFVYNGLKYLPTSTGSTDIDILDACYGPEFTSVEIPVKFSVDGKTYNVNESNRYLLCGQSSMTDLNVVYPYKELPNGLAYNARSLKNVQLPVSVTKISDFSFAGTDSLASITLPASVESFGLAAFYYSGLKELTVPGNVTLMDNGSVFGCRKLRKLTFEDGVKSVLIGYMPTMFGNRPMFSSSQLDSVIIGRDLEYLTGAGYGYSPFYGDSIVQHVVFTDAVNVINRDLFRDCKYLRDVTSGNRLSKIMATAFYGCLSLDSVSFGNALQQIGANAFQKCTAMTRFYCAAVVPPTCTAAALADINKNTCKLFVPFESIDAYKAAAEWKEFFNIEGHQFSGVGAIFGDETPSRYIVYTLSGTLLLDTQDATLVNALPAGVYIINGKKVVIR